MGGTLESVQVWLGSRLLARARKRCDKDGTGLADLVQHGLMLALAEGTKKRKVKRKKKA